MATDADKKFEWSCPLPATGSDKIQLAHGGGGRLTQQLIESVFLPAFGNACLNEQHDGAVFAAEGRQLAFTTDSYVVRPLFFPGGNIGDLAVNGTVNDLAMCGARPRWMSCGLILEEGLPMETLRAVVESMRAAAKAAGVQIVTGDTKVVDKGKGDGIYINTAGVGVVEANQPVTPSRVQSGDVVIISGDLGAHGVTILSVREGLEFEATVESDTAPLWQPVDALLAAGIDVHCLRDLTRGGLSSALNEIAAARQLGIRIEETAVPVQPVVRGACEILGLDPLYVANEGRLAAFVSANQAGQTLEILRRFAPCRDAAKVGVVVEEDPGLVILRSAIGGNRVLDMLSGEQLPRIC